MLFRRVVEVFERIEATTKRLQMTDQLVELVKATPSEVIDKVAYLVTGTIYPAFAGVELGVAEKLGVKAIAAAAAVREEKVSAEYKRSGDLGGTAESILSKKVSVLVAAQPLTVEGVYETLEKICHASGSGAQESKIRLLSSLLTGATPKEARYILRIALGRLRLGVADMTLLDALAIAYGGGKEARDLVERAYNFTSDIGFVARKLATDGLDAARHVQIGVGRPVKPQMAERLSSIEEILAKMGGECSAEYKYDGLRVQAHMSRGKVVLFSRRQENITSQFPDIAIALREAISAREAILDGEAVPTDPNTGDLLPFQVISQRRGRKHEIEKMVGEVPVVLCLFDALYVDGRDLSSEPYLKRRERLAQVTKETEKVRIAESIVTDDPQEISAFFDRAVQEGTEGLVCKSVSPESVYEAGKRGWAWIKWKRSYRSEMADTVDLTVVGGFAGRGKRAGVYGALLMATYNAEQDRFDTVCKLGSGFTDEDLARLPEVLKPHLVEHPHARVNALMKADYWFIPALVLEVIGDEVTLSPLHTAGLGAVRTGSGLAIRFPRLVRFREERAPEDSTTVKEIMDMYHRQLKRVEAETQEPSGTVQST